MKTHRETGDPGCRAVILKYLRPLPFGSWRLSLPPYQEQVLRGAYTVSNVDIFKMGLRKYEDTFCFVRYTSSW